MIDSARTALSRWRAVACARAGLRENLDRMIPLVRLVMHQTRARIFHGDTHVEGKILSVFEPSTEVIRKGKVGKPNEFESHGGQTCVYS
jgi:hypothetical protein